MDIVAPGILAGFEQTLKDVVGESRYKLWLESHTRWHLDDAVLTVGVPNRFYRDWLDSQFREAIQTSIAQVLGKGVAIRFRIDPELFRQQHQAIDETGITARPISDRATALEGRAAQRGPVSSSRPTSTRFALPQFVVGSANRVAYAAACSLIENPRNGYSPLVVHGPCGLGKTHLLKAIEDEVARRHPRLRLVALTGEEFTNNFLESMKNHRLSLFRKQLRCADLFLVDDVQFLAGKKATQEEFLHTLHALEARGAKIVLSMHLHPRKLERFAAELSTRFLSGMTARLDPMDHPMRRQVVADKAIERRLELNAEMIELLADKLRNSVSEIEGTLNYLNHVCETFRVKPTLELVHQGLAEMVRHAPPMVRVAEVQKRVCELFGVAPKVLRLRSRVRSVSQARMLTLYLARRHTAATYSEIGREIGGLNHSSVISAERRIQDEIRKDGEIVLGDRTWKVRDAVEAFERELGRL